MAGDQSGVVETDVEVRGATMHLRSTQGDGPEILIVHGWPESSVAWSPILERAASDSPICPSSWCRS